MDLLSMIEDLLRKRARGGSHECIKVSAMSEILTEKVSKLQKP
jgi:hypothetical protein